MSRKLMLERAIDEVIFQAQAVRQVRLAGWTNIETQVAFADLLFHQNDLVELVGDLADESVDSLAEAIAHDLESAFNDGSAYNLRKLVLSRVNWKQLAARLLEWAGVNVQGVQP